MVLNTHLVVSADYDFLLLRLILHGVVCLLYQVIQIEVLLVEFKVHSLQLSEVQQVVYQGDQHTRLI